MKGMTRRNFVKMAGIAMATAAAGSLWQDKTSLAETADAPAAPKAAEGGDHYVAPSQRQGGEAVVYFTRDLSAAGLLKAYDAIAQNMTGKVGIKLHTGEPHGPNIIPRHPASVGQDAYSRETAESQYCRNEYLLSGRALYDGRAPQDAGCQRLGFCAGRYHG